MSTLKRKQPLERYMRIADAATYLGVTRSGVYGLVKRGRIPTVRLGRMLLVDRQRLDAVLQAVEASAAAEVHVPAG